MGLQNAQIQVQIVGQRQVDAGTGRRGRKANVERGAHDQIEHQEPTRGRTQMRPMRSHRG